MRYRIKIIERFIADRCAISKRESVQATDLYSAYLDWCQANEEMPVTIRYIGRIWQFLGFLSVHARSGTRWEGIGLKKATTALLEPQGASQGWIQEEDSPALPPAPSNG